MDVQRADKGKAKRSGRSNYRFNAAFKELMRQVGISLGGVSDTDVIRISVKKMADQQGIR
jgi:hypothetical protein